MPIAPLLQRFIDDELALAPTLAARVVAGTVELLAPSPRDAAFDERARFSELAFALLENAALYEQTFVDALRTHVAAEVEQHVPTSAGSHGEPGALEPIDESQVEADIEIARATQLIASTAQWQLRELQTFTSTLAGERHVTADSNPFAPLAYTKALWDAASAVVVVPVDRATVLRTSAAVLGGLVKSVCAAAAARLEVQGVEPAPHRAVVAPHGTRSGRPAQARPNGLRALLSSTPRQPVRPDAPGGRTPFEPHRVGLFAGANEPPDWQIVDLVARIFAAIDADSQRPEPVRRALGRMRVAVVRACLADRTTLDSFEHAAWRTLDRIGEAPIGHARADDPTLVAFAAFIDAVAEEMARAADPDASSFKRTLDRVDAFLAQQLQERVRAAHATALALQAAERRQVLQEHVAQRLAEQMDRMGPSIRTSPAIRGFLTGTWANVVVASMLRHGEQSVAAFADLKTADDLLWSLQVPDHAHSHQRLLALLPGLLQRMRLGMAAVELPSAEQQGVLDELMTLHTEALRSGTRRATATPSAEEIVRHMRDEVVPVVPARRDFSDAMIDSSMATAPAGHRDAHDAVSALDALRVGDRRRVFLGRRWRRVQLLWRSDRGLFFLFAGESAQRHDAITRRALERLASAGLVQPLETKPLVERAVEQLLRDRAAHA